MQLVPLLELLCLQLSWIVLFSVHRGNKHAPVHYQLSNLVPSLNGVSIIYKVHVGIHETALPHTPRNWIITRSYQDVGTANAGTMYNIDLLWYCIVHIFVVSHFCDSMWSFWVEANLSLVYICFVVGDSVIQSRMLGSHQTPPHLCVCPKPGSEFPTS